MIFFGEHVEGNERTTPRPKLDATLCRNSPEITYRLAKLAVIPPKNPFASGYSCVSTAAAGVLCTLQHPVYTRFD